MGDIRHFGRDDSGSEAVLITLRNQGGMSVTFSNYGARLVSIICPDREGNPADVCLGFDSLHDYQTRSGYLGATIGRFANRIGGAVFELNGQIYPLYPNNGKNTLHGGKAGFDRKFWEYEAKGNGAVIFRCISADGEEGFPGKMDVQVTFTLQDNSALRIDYEAVSDRDTVLNLTNHAYFNLAGKGTVHGHYLQIHSDYVLKASEDLIPTGELQPVSDTPYDLRGGKTIGDCLAMKGQNPMFDGACGFDIDYILPGEGLREAAVLWEPVSGRLMRVITDQPGIQVYSGQGLSGVAKNGGVFEPYSGIALETQHHPDSVHHPHLPSTVLKAGEVFRSSTIYAFEK
jgi:aldose 1-epimerase